MHLHLWSFLLRKGKFMKKSGSYIWRTQKDGKVRPEHAWREGVIFEWSNPPEDGHPGEDFGCAESYEGEKPTGLKLEINQPVKDTVNKWKWDDFILHFYQGGGKTVTLAGIWHMETIVYASYESVVPRLLEQLSSVIERYDSEYLYYTTRNSYEFKSHVYAIGGATVSTETVGTIKNKDKLLHVDAEVRFSFNDLFTDPLSLRENGGGSRPPKGEEFSEIFGQAYEINGHWKAILTGTLKPNKSLY